eukprot:m.72935 g.72935  ORF g.72935 m.72935 type:complete len:177 (-) comp10178_c0_seq3:78-608(-)
MTMCLRVGYEPAKNLCYRDSPTAQNALLSQNNALHRLETCDFLRFNCFPDFHIPSDPRESMATFFHVRVQNVLLRLPPAEATFEKSKIPLQCNPKFLPMTGLGAVSPAHKQTFEQVQVYKKTMSKYQDEKQAPLNNEEREFDVSKNFRFDIAATSSMSRIEHWHAETIHAMGILAN